MLELDHLTKTYSNGHTALADVSLSLGPGVVGLLGPNGAGKSTLMTILATVTRPTSGTFRWKGTDGVANPVAVRRELGYLPQDFGIYERLTATEFLLYLGRLKGLSGKALGERVDGLLELVNLHNAAKRPLGGFSGGMRQRVGIAQALLGDPKLLIVDEPTVGLDPDERVRFRNLLAEIAHDRVVILSTHIVSDVEAVATTLAVLRQGKLIAVATPEEILQRAVGRVFSLRVASDQLTALQQRVHVASLVQRTDGARVRFVCAGDPPAGAVAVDPTLEDAYLWLRREGVAA